MRLRIVNLEPLYFSEEAKDILKSELSYSEADWDDVMADDFKSRADIIIVRFKKKIDKNVLGRFPQLKIIFTATTGTDHIDIDYCEERKIKICCLKPHKDFLKTIPSTAEHTFGLILSLLRNIPKANASVSNGNWNRDLFFGSQLKNKNLGIIGLGRTGSLVAKYAAVFGMNVFFYDPFFKHGNDYCKAHTLKELLQQSDIITLHVHLDSTTKGMINSEIATYFKKGSWLINTSRGKIVDEDVVVELLESGVLKGIASDVISNEAGILEENALYKGLQRGLNIILTPHIGGATRDALNDCEVFLSRQLIASLQQVGPLCKKSVVAAKN